MATFAPHLLYPAHLAEIQNVLAALLLPRHWPLTHQHRPGKPSAPHAHIRGTLQYCTSKTRHEVKMRPALCSAIPRMILSSTRCPKMCPKSGRGDGKKCRSSFTRHQCECGVTTIRPKAQTRVPPEAVPANVPTKSRSYPLRCPPRCPLRCPQWCPLKVSTKMEPCFGRMYRKN